MSHAANFISHALRCISEAVIAIIAKTDLHVRKDGVSKRLAQRTRAQLKALEQMLRRVIMLIAIGLSETIGPPPLARPRVRLLAGIRLAPVRAPKAPKPLRPRDPHLPPPYGGGCGDVDFASLPKGKPGKPVNVRKLIKRIQTLQAVLENPEPMAHRLAVHYARLRLLHTELPTPPPEIPMKRAGAELSLVAGALPMELVRAAQAWNNSS